MELIGHFDSPKWGRIAAIRGNYLEDNGPVAVMLEAPNGQLLTVLSVNMYKPECSEDSQQLPKNCFYVKTWSENKDIFEDARKSGLFKERPDLPIARSGHVSAPAWEIVDAN